jgi:hypothetical protein
MAEPPLSRQADPPIPIDYNCRNKGDAQPDGSEPFHISFFSRLRRQPAPLELFCSDTRPAYILFNQVMLELTVVWLWEVASVVAATMGSDHRGKRRGWTGFCRRSLQMMLRCCPSWSNLPERVQKELDLRHLMSLTRIFVFDAILSPSSSLECGLLKLSVLISGIGGVVRLQPLTTSTLQITSTSSSL